MQWKSEFRNEILMINPIIKSTNNMSHNPQHEPMEPWIIWAGVGIMMFTVIIFVIFTLSVMYF
jgi:hypothetical protein